MSSDNPTADRLVEGARKKEASQQSPVLAWVGIALAVVGAACLVLFTDATQAALAGWVTGAIAVGLGFTSLKRGAPGGVSKVSLVLGVIVILVATFTFCYAQAVYS